MKRVKEVRFVLPVILLFVLVLCAGLALAASTYTGADNGKTITVKNGDTFTVKLDENPTTGYSWNMTLGSGLQKVSDQYVRNNTGLIGSGGYHTWTIKATTPGLHKITAIYKRPWEQTAGNETTYTLNVFVTAASQGGSVSNMSFPSFGSFQHMLDFKPKFALNMTSFDKMFAHFPKLFG